MIMRKNFFQPDMVGYTWDMIVGDTKQISSEEKVNPEKVLAKRIYGATIARGFYVQDYPDIVSEVIYGENRVNEWNRQRFIDEGLILLRKYKFCTYPETD